MTTTLESLKTIFPRATSGWLEEALHQMPHYGVDTPNEMATFLAQCGHESGGFRFFEENLNYSAERLLVIWPKRFKTIDVAKIYAHNPEELANFVYANRHGNRDALSGDGWRFRGRGAIQLTFMNNYMLCGHAIGEDLLGDPDKLLLPYFGIRAALWYWKERDLDAVDDDEDQKQDTRLINGGENGLKHREELAALIRKQFET